MRVLHVLKTFFPDTYGGIEQVVHTLASHTQPLGVENRVLVLTPGEPRRGIEPAGYEVIRYKRDLYVASTGFSLSLLANFKKEAEWADVMHMHFPWPYADLCYLLNGIKKPSLISYHSDVVNQVQLNKLYAPLRDRYLAKMSRIYAASPGIMQSSPVLQKFKDKTRLITYGIEHFDQLSADDAAVQVWQEKFGPRFFLFLGALRYYKGLHVLIEALKGRDYPTVIVGRGDQEQALKQQAKELGLKNLHFVPEVSNEEKRTLMRAAYGFVFPSHMPSEAFGIVLAEAAQQGLPMISCEIGTGTSYVNLDGETGLVVPPSDSVAFGQALDLFWNGPEQVGVWGRGALQRYEENFKAETMAERYMRAYGEVLGKSASI
jgi:glycosyltransferase involved in cell wall biosynthesis